MRYPLSQTLRRATRSPARVHAHPHAPMHGVMPGVSRVMRIATLAVPGAAPRAMAVSHLPAQPGLAATRRLGSLLCSPLPLCSLRRRFVRGAARQGRGAGGGLGAMLAGIRFLRTSGAIDKLDKLTSVLSDNSSLTFSPSACVSLRSLARKVGVPEWARPMSMPPPRH